MKNLEYVGSSLMLSHSNLFKCSFWGERIALIGQKKLIVAIRYIESMH